MYSQQQHGSSCRNGFTSAKNSTYLDDKISAILNRSHKSNKLKLYLKALAYLQKLD